VPDRLAQAEAGGAAFAVIGPLAPGENILQLGERMRHVEMLGAEALPVGSISICTNRIVFSLSYRVGRGNEPA
jgi:hypothetical protein